MVKVGIIGCGKIAQVRHIPEYLDNPNAKLTGLYDLNLQRAKELAEKYLKKITPILTILILSVTLLPSTKSCYRIIGLGTVIEYSKTNEKVKELPENFIKAINDYLEKDVSKNRD